MKKHDSKLKYPEIALKLSGEALSGKGAKGYSKEAMFFLAEEIRKVHELGGKTVIIMGGGNIARGTELEEVGIERPDADYMGMLFTAANAMGFKHILKKKFNIPVRVATSILLPTAGEYYVAEKVLHALREKNEHVIIACGTGNAFFSTDTAAVLRALELDLDAVLKGTKVDGVYDKNPSDPSAILLKQLTPREMLKRELEVMDFTSTSLLFDNMKKRRLPMIVFNIFKEGNLVKVLTGDDSIGSHVVYNDLDKDNG